MSTPGDEHGASVAPTADDHARRRIRGDLATSLLVEAAAGTGKTTELVTRLVAILEQGLGTVDGIVAVTFTRKAAGELKLRLRQELDRARARAAAGTGRDHLERAIAHLEEARIGTIHSFCAEILRERPVEAGVDPDFEELLEDEQPRVYDQAFQGWIQDNLNAPPEGLHRALTRLTTKPNYQEAPLDKLRDAGARLIEWRDFPAPWQRPELDRIPLIDTLVERVRALAAAAASCSDQRDYLKRALRPVEHLATWVERSEAVGGRDHDALEGRLGDLLIDLRKDKRKGYGRAFGDGHHRDEVAELRTQLMAELEDFRSAADADLAALLRDELWQVVERYEALKAKLGKLDFVDLLIRARDLVRGNGEVRRYLQARFSHIFVDEFQDTDPLQAELLVLLAADDGAVTDWHQVRPRPGKLFLVGDPKQSIYRFRRADMLLYQGLKDRLVASGVDLVHLSTSFRAVRPLQEMINAAFAPEMTGDRTAGQSDYVPLDPHAPGPQGQPSIVALPVPYPYSKYKPRITSWAIDASLPDAVTGYVQWLLEDSGWTVRDPQAPARRVPIQARHICVLFRRFMSWQQDVTREYVRGLEARGIPHLLVGARSYYQREEVETVRAALTAIEWPDDELNVYATLRGSLFALPDALLVRYRAQFKNLVPFTPDMPQPGELQAELEPVRDALVHLGWLHAERNQVPLVETLSRLLDFTRAHAGFALRPAGHQILANVLKVADLARSWELSFGISFRGFVERLNTEAQKPASGESPTPEEGADGVRIMTVHAAKGLEYPVVILGDLSCRLHSDQPDRYVDPERALCALRLLGCTPQDLLQQAELECQRDAAEGIRIAYVAATRARDLLVVPAVGDEAHHGWLQPLTKALYPTAGARRQSAPAPGCPTFGDRSVVQRHPEADARAEFSIRPGLVTPQQGEHQVVWWDPNVLDLSTRSRFGLRTAEILAEDADGTANAAGAADYADWRERRATTLTRGARPSHDVLTATEATDPPPGRKTAIIREQTPKDRSRPRGKRFGTLVHTVLRDVALDATEAQVLELALLHGRLLGCPRREVEAAAAATLKALAHPLLERARKAERCHREAPLMVDLEDGRVLEGTIDLAFLADDQWTVVDFKTDQELETRRDHYERQVAWYVYGMTKLSGRKTRGVLFRV